MIRPTHSNVTNRENIVPSTPNAMESRKLPSVTVDTAKTPCVYQADVNGKETSSRMYDLFQRTRGKVKPLHTSFVIQSARQYKDSGDILQCSPPTHVEGKALFREPGLYH